jgi:hypothetical protein
MLLSAGVASVHGQTLLFADEFSTNSSDVNRAIWDNPSPGWMLGRTFMRTYSAYPVPVANDYAELRLDTYNAFANPPGSSVLGTEIATRTYFPVGKGLAFEARVWIDPLLPGGTITSLFSYVFRDLGGGNLQQDEIDWEFLSNKFVGSQMGQVSTNVYKDEYLGSGQPAEFGVPAATMQGVWNTFRVEWYPNRVRWLMNGRPVFQRFDRVPNDAMNVRMNFWAPDSNWAAAYSSALQGATGAAQNVTYRYRVDYLRVFALPGFGDSDLTGDGRVDIEELYRINRTPQDVNNDGSANAEDTRAVMRAVRELEPLDVTDRAQASRFPIVANPGFEALIPSSPLLGWSAFGASNGNVLREDIVPRSGAYHLKLFGQFNGTTNQSGVYQDIPVRAGQTITVGAWARHITGDSIAGANVAYLDLLFRNAQGQTVETNNIVALTSASPRDVHIPVGVSRTAPADAVAARVQFRFAQQGNAAGAANFDDLDISLTQP